MTLSHCETLQPRSWQHQATQLVPGLVKVLGLGFWGLRFRGLGFLLQPTITYVFVGSFCEFGASGL